MKIFNVALQINNKDIAITLIENSKRTPKINLGGVEYYINYSGIEYFEAVKTTLQDYFKKLTIAVTKKNLETCLKNPSLYTAGYNRLLMLPRGASIPSTIPQDAILVKMVGPQLTTYKMIGDRVTLDNNLYLSQDKISEINGYFASSGEKKNEITKTNDLDLELFNKITLLCGYTPNVAVSSTQEKLQRALKHAAEIGKGLSEIEGGYNQIWLLPLGAKIPASIPENVILIKMVGPQITTYKMIGDTLTEDNKLWLPHQIAEISSNFPPHGEDPKKVSIQNNQDLFNNLAFVCGYTIHNKQVTETESKKLQGRMILEDYNFEVQKNEDGKLIQPQQRLLVKAWRLDKSTALSLPEWETFKRAQQEKSGSEKEFFPWLLDQAWKDSKTTDDYYTWFLRDDHQTFNIQSPFEDFKKMVTNHVLKNRHLLGEHASDADVIDFSMEHATSGSNLSEKEFFQYKQWKLSDSEESFERWSMRQEWEKIPKTDADKTEANFIVWESSKLAELQERWNKSGLQQAGLSFDLWREQQDDTLRTDNGTREFIRCDEASRARYQLKIATSGQVSRNGQPYNTEYESTLHSGKGYAIFVIGPSQEVYSGSHISQVFHHSSFFADGAIRTGGEIRMGLDLSVKAVKDEAEKNRAIKQFQKNNKDPYLIQLIKNESNKSWCIVGKDDSGKVKSFDLRSDSELGIKLENFDLKKCSFAKRSEIIDEASALLGRVNNKDQITLLSSKSGHYHPGDKDNYYMLKFWEQKGVDLDKITFASYGSTGPISFSSAKEYLKSIEPMIQAIQARENALLLINESGTVENHSQKVLSENNFMIVINKKGECYKTDDYGISFTHPKIASRENKLELKSNIELEIKKLEESKLLSREHISQLDDEIKHGKKRLKGSRNIKKDAELSRIDTLDKKIAALKEVLDGSPRPERDEVKGGGIITTNDRGEIVKIDTKLGDYTLSEREVNSTLTSLATRGVNLETVELVTYNNAGESQKFSNASLYLVANKSKPSNITSLAGSHNKQETESEFNFNQPTIQQNNIAQAREIQARKSSLPVINEEDYSSSHAATYFDRKNSSASFSTSRYPLFNTKTNGQTNPNMENSSNNQSNNKEKNAGDIKKNSSTTPIPTKR